MVTASLLLLPCISVDDIIVLVGSLDLSDDIMDTLLPVVPAILVFVSVLNKVVENGEVLLSFTAFDSSSQEPNMSLHSKPQ